jgi:hypothetical protein
MKGRVKHSEKKVKNIVNGEEGKWEAKEKK